MKIVKGLVISALLAASCTAQDSGSAYSKSSVELNMAMRKLWEEHIFYTRNFIISDLGNLEDVPEVTKRLLRNQDDIGNAIKPYYGSSAGNQLTKLLRDHIMIAGDVVNSAKEGNDEELKDNYTKWQMNADDLAKFLSEANPNWDQKALKDMLYKHLDLTRDEVVSRLKSDWSGDVNAFDKGNDHILKLSDALSEGIVKQFPNKF